MKLSKRELEVAKKMKEGWKNKLIAEYLNIDQKTVSTYIKRIVEKIGYFNHPSNSYNSYTIVKRCEALGFFDHDETEG